MAVFWPLGFYEESVFAGSNSEKSENGPNGVLDKPLAQYILFTAEGLSLLVLKLLFGLKIRLVYPF